MCPPFWYPMEVCMSTCYECCCHMFACSLNLHLYESGLLLGGCALISEQQTDLSNSSSIHSLQPSKGGSDSIMTVSLIDLD